MKNAVWLPLTLLAACGGVEESEHTAGGSNDAIVLECEGNTIDLVSSKRQPASSLIKIEPSNLFPQSLDFYNWDEKRFVSTCLDKGFECRISVGPDLIEELGIMKGNDGEVILQRHTEINRRTGTIRVVMNDSFLGERPVFEGDCANGKLPVEQAQKF